MNHDASTHSRFEFVAINAVYFLKGLKQNKEIEQRVFIVIPYETKELKD